MILIQQLVLIYDNLFPYSLTTDHINDKMILLQWFSYAHLEVIVVKQWY